VTTAPETTPRPESKTQGRIPKPRRPHTPRTTRNRRNLLIAAAATAAVVAVGVATTQLLTATPDDIPGGAGDAPIAFPDTMLGLAPLQRNDGTQSPTWLAQAKQAGAGATVVGRTYGAPNPAKTIRVVAARTDLADKLELTWRADNGHLVGETKIACTNNVTIGEHTKVRPTVMLCWRTTPTFSVYSLIIDPKSKGVPDTDGAAAVEAAWSAAVKGS
jgi:hypothetical protein